MNVTREEMIDILNKLAGELEAGLGRKWKASTATGEESYSVKIEVQGIDLAVDQWPQQPSPPEPDLFDQVDNLESVSIERPGGHTVTVTKGKKGGRKSH